VQGSEFDEAEFFRAIAASGARVALPVPTLDDLILTKRFGGRPKDLAYVRRAYRRWQAAAPAARS
jgi:hypothetical protein